MNDKSCDHTIEVKVRLELGTSLWTTLASNAIALALAVCDLLDLLNWLIK